MPLCPQCGEDVAKTDTHCMDCGADLIAHKQKDRRTLREQSLSARSGTTKTPPKGGAAAGRAVAGETAEKTRIRAFDRQDAQRLAQERVTAWITATVSLVIGIALSIIGFGRVKAGGGFEEVFPALKPTSLREVGLGMFTDPTILGVALLGLGLAGLLIGVGQASFAMAGSRAIRDVKNKIKPEIARVSTMTLVGLFMVSIFCPPLGLIIGLIFFFGRNPDLKAPGGNMAMLSVAVMALLGLNMLGKLAASMKAAASAKAK